MMSQQTQTTTQQKPNIIERLGGERDFQFIVLSLVDHLREDRELARFFSPAVIEMNSLASLQEDFLKAAFADRKNDGSTNKGLAAHIRVRYYRLMHEGFDEKHFDLIVSHFVEALREAWVDDEELIGDAVEKLNSCRHIFENTKQNNCKSVLPASTNARSFGAVGTPATRRF